MQVAPKETTNMINNEFLAEVYKTPLKREPKTLKYTLGNKKLDDLFDLGQVSSGFGPSKESVTTFAAATFLYGVIGYNATNYTSVPGGFLVTYQKENNGKSDVATILVTDEEGIYWADALVETYKKEIQNGKYNEAEQSILLPLHNMMCTKRFFESPLYKCLGFADVINSKAEAMPTLKQNVLNAIFPFSSSREPMSLNIKNCEENHTLIDMFCAKEMGLDYDDVVDSAIGGEDYAQAQMEEIKEMRESLLNDWILPGYFTFVGNKRGVPTIRDAQILNNQDWFGQLQAKVKNPKALAAIVNICATDYSADVVYGILDTLNNSSVATNGVTALEGIFNIMPDTPKNKEQVAQIRENFWRKYYAQNEGYEKE